MQPTRASPVHFALQSTRRSSGAGSPQFKIWLRSDRFVSVLGAFPTHKDRIARTDLARHITPPSASIEDFLPRSLREIFRVIGRNWHRRFSPSLLRLGDDFKNKPLCLIGASRVEFDTKPVPKFARALCAAEDFLGSRADYDFYFGAMAVPQIAELGKVFSRLSMLKGDVPGRIAELLRVKGSDPDNTVYEFLVAGAFTKFGVPVEFVKTSTAKTPDLHVGSDHSRLFIECKRRSGPFQYEREEAAKLQLVFETLRSDPEFNEVHGVYEIDFFVPVAVVDENELYRALRKGRALRSRAYHQWGSIEFLRFDSEIPVSLTRLYSPIFLSKVFGWSCDIPSHDGMVCQVASPSSFTVDRAHKPFAIKWNSLSNEAIEKKSRAVTSLLGDALKQFPKKCWGVPYICYPESSRIEIADKRTANIQREFKDIFHDASFRVPEIRVNRLYASPIGDGGPDLIENTLEIVADFVLPENRGVFPSSVFTNPISFA